MSRTGPSSPTGSDLPEVVAVGDTYPEVSPQQTYPFQTHSPPTYQSPMIWSPESPSDHKGVYSLDQQAYYNNQHFHPAPYSPSAAGTAAGLSSIGGQPPQHPPAGPAGPDVNQPWWKRKKSIIWMLTALVVVLLIILGIVLGVVLGKKGNSGDASSGSDTDTGNPDNTPGTGNGDGVTLLNIHPQSDLSAANFTDNRGLMHRLVAYQDLGGCIMITHWDPVSRDWLPVNVTKAFVGTDQEPVAGRPARIGTPIEMHVRGNDAFGQQQLIYQGAAQFTLNIYFVTEHGILVEAITSNRAAMQEGWSLGDLTSFALQLVEGSSIGGVFTRYMDWGLMNLLFVQLVSDPQKVTRYIWDASGWNPNLTMTELPNANPVVMAATPFWENRTMTLYDGNQTDGADSMRLFWNSNSTGKITEIAPYSTGEDTPSREVSSAPTGRKNFMAATSWSVGGGQHDNVMFGTLQDSSFTLSHWSPDVDWETNSATLTGTPDGLQGSSKWLGLSFTQDRYAYALIPAGDDPVADGVKIHEFTFAEDSQFSWAYSSQVAVS